MFTNNYIGGTWVHDIFHDKQHLTLIIYLIIPLHYYLSINLSIVKTEYVSTYHMKKIFINP